LVPSELTGGDGVADLTFTEKIRQRAFDLWQLDGCLEGCADGYWRMARALVEGESASSALLDPTASDQGASG
jgi:hypothetical protein